MNSPLSNTVRKIRRNWGNSKNDVLVIEIRISTQYKAVILCNTLLAGLNSFPPQHFPCKEEKLMIQTTIVLCQKIESFMLRFFFYVVLISLEFHCSATQQNAYSTIVFQCDRPHLFCARSKETSQGYNLDSVLLFFHQNKKKKSI